MNSQPEAGDGAAVKKAASRALLERLRNTLNKTAAGRGGGGETAGASNNNKVSSLRTSSDVVPLLRRLDCPRSKPARTATVVDVRSRVGATQIDRPSVPRLSATRTIVSGHTHPIALAFSCL